MKVTNKVRLSLIKTKALTLYKNYQIPFQLVYYIQGLNENSDKRYVRLLCDLCEHYLRVKNYYKKYKDVAKEVNDLIDKSVTDFLSSLA